MRFYFFSQNLFVYESLFITYIVGMVFRVYLIGQNFVGQNFRRTKCFVGQNFRYQAEILTILSDFCLTFVLKYWTKFSTDKIFDTKLKFRHFCTIFAWLLYWNIGQNFRRTKFFVGGNFRHRVEISKIFPTNFCPIRYLKIRGWYSDYRGRNYFVNTRQAKVYTIKRILLGGPETIIRIMELFQLQTIGI